MKSFYLLIPLCFLVANPALAQETSTEESTEEVESEAPKEAPKKDNQAKKETDSEAKKEDEKIKEDGQGEEPAEETPAPTKVEPESEVVPEAAPEAAPEVVPEAAPEVVPEVVPEAAPEVAPEVIMQAEPELVPEPKPVAEIAITNEAATFSPSQGLDLRANLTGAVFMGGFDYASKPYEHESTNRFMTILELQADYSLGEYVEGLTVGMSLPFVISSLYLVGESASNAKSAKTNSSWSSVGMGDLSLAATYDYSVMEELLLTGELRYKAATGEGDVGTNSQMEYSSIPTGSGHHHLQAQLSGCSNVLDTLFLKADLGWMVRFAGEREVSSAGVVSRATHNPGDLFYLNLGAEYEVMDGLVPHLGFHFSAGGNDAVEGLVLENTNSQALGVSLGANYEINNQLQAHVLFGGGGLAQGLNLQQGVLLWGKNVESATGFTVGLSGTF